MNLRIKAATALLMVTYLVAYVDTTNSTNDVIEDGYNQNDLGPFNFTQLCDYFKLDCEEHEVTTEDGYILTVYNVKGDKTRPVLIWHGIFDSCDTMLMRGPKSIVFNLAAAGFDIWLGNSRGNKYSRRHQYLDPVKDKRKFWDFSFHEKGYYDMAASIDYVLEKTGQTTLSVIGHSEGTTMYFVLASERPIYNNKVRLFIAMAPIAFLTHVKLQLLAPLWKVLSALLATSGTYELLGKGNILSKICQNEVVAAGFCYPVVMEAVGWDPEEFELDFLMIMAQHFPAGSSKRDLDHYVQVYERKKFALFDYGALKNLEKYKSLSPPNYDLKKVNSSVALLCGANDHLSTLEDVKQLREGLPNVVEYKVMERKLFNHIDFVIGKHMDEYMTPLLENLLNKYN